MSKIQVNTEDFVMDMATSVLPKGYADIFDMINSTADVFAKDSELHQRLNGIDSVSKELLGDKYSERASKGLGRAAAISEFISNLSSIEAGLLDIDDESKVELFNIGGYTVRNTAKTPPGYGKYSIAYDLQAILQLHELQTYGLRPYIYRANGGDYRVVEAFDLLLKHGQLNALFESVCISELGIYIQRERFIQYTLSDLTYQQDGSFKWTRNNIYGIKESDDFDISYSAFERDVRGDKLLGELGALQDKKLAATGDLLKELALLGAGRYSKPLEGLVLLTSDLPWSDTISDNLNLANGVSERVLGESHPEGWGSLVSGVSSVFSFVEEMASIAQQEVALKEEHRSMLFDTGGISVDPTRGNVRAKYDMTYDLQAQLQAYDMAQNGLRFYAYRQLEEEKFNQFNDQLNKLETTTWTDSAIERFLYSGERDTKKRGLMHEDVRNLLAGRGDKKISEVGEDKIWKGLDIIQETANNFGFKVAEGWRATYLEENTNYFEELVKHTPKVEDTP